MDFVFFGTPKFAAIILEKLIKAGFSPALVICNPDKPVGRKKIITSPPTKILAEKHGIKVRQPEKLEINGIKADFAVVAAYAKIIPKEILDFFPKGVIGVHPSLLPRYRGPSPIQSAILAGEKETGVTLYLLDEKVDHGPILARDKLQILNSDNYESLSLKLAELGGKLLAETLPKFLNGEIKPQPQNEAEATYTKKITTENAFVKPEELRLAQETGGVSAQDIYLKVKALNPEPGVWTVQNNKRVKILEADLDVEGKLKFKKIQIEGKKPKPVS